MASMRISLDYSLRFCHDCVSMALEQTRLLVKYERNLKPLTSIFFSPRDRRVKTSQRYLRKKVMTQSKRRENNLTNSGFRGGPDGGPDGGPEGVQMGVQKGVQIGGPGFVPTR